MSQEPTLLESKRKAGEELLQRILEVFQLPGLLQDRADEHYKYLLYSMDMRNDRVVIRAYLPQGNAQNTMVLTPEKDLEKYDVYWFVSGHGDDTDSTIRPISVAWIGDATKVYQAENYVIPGSEIATLVFSKTLVEKHFSDPDKSFLKERLDREAEGNRRVEKLDAWDGKPPMTDLLGINKMDPFAIHSQGPRDAMIRKPGELTSLYDSTAHSKLTAAARATSGYGISLDGGVVAGVIADQLSLKAPNMSITGRTEITQVYGAGGGGGMALEGKTAVIPGIPVVVDGMAVGAGGGSGGAGWIVGGVMVPTEEQAQQRAIRDFADLLNDPALLLKEVAKDDETIPILLKHKAKTTNADSLAMIDKLLHMACFAWMTKQIKKNIAVLTGEVGDSMFDKPSAELSAGIRPGLMPTGIDELDDSVDRRLAGLDEQSIHGALGVIDLTQDPSVTALTSDYPPGESPADPESQGS